MRPHQSKWRLFSTASAPAIYIIRGLKILTQLHSPLQMSLWDGPEAARSVSPQKARLFCLARAARVGEKASPCVRSKPLGFTPPVISRENWAFPNDFTLSNALVNPSRLSLAALESVKKE